MTSMISLDLSENNLVGMMPSNMKNLCSLEELNASANNIRGSIAEILERLPSLIFFYHGRLCLTTLSQDAYQPS